MSNLEVAESPLNSPFAAAKQHSSIFGGEVPERRPGRRFAHNLYRVPRSAARVPAEVDVGTMTEGFDELEDIKRGAAERWVSAVNAEGSFGKWSYRVAKQVSEVPGIISAAARG